MNQRFAKNVVFNCAQLLRGEQVTERYHEVKNIPYLSSEEITRLQYEKLRRVLQAAYDKIPYYREVFRHARIDIRRMKLPEDMKKIPVLRRQKYKNNYAKLVNKSMHCRVTREMTSGSSGNPLIVLKDREKSAYIRAVMYRCYHQYGIEIGDKQARFWGVPVSPQNILKEKLKDMLANRIRLSAFDIHERSLDAFTNRLLKFRPKYFYGYPSVLHKYAAWLDQREYAIGKELKLNAVITTGEILYDFQRRAIQNSFSCPVVNEYGSTELGVIAFECSRGHLHLNADHVYVETVHDGDLHYNQLVVTELNNAYNPLIRYQIGDRGNIGRRQCGCGINFPVLSALVGRDSTFIVTPDGRYINDAILEYILSGGIRRFRARQTSSKALEINILKEPELSEKMMENYKQQLSRKLGDSIKITFKFVPEIEPEESGKLRYFISEVN